MSDDIGPWPLLTRLTRAVASGTDLSARMAQAIRADLAFYRTDATVPLAEMEVSARAHIAALTHPAPTPEERDTAPRELGERRARDGVELTDVMDALRSGTKFLWDQIVAHARRLGTVSDAELVELASQIWFMHDAFMQAVTAGYRRESARALLSRQQERLGLLYGLLTARGSEAASPWNAVDRLGLPRTGGFAVVAVAAPATGRMPLPRIEQALAESGVVSAWVMAGTVQLGVVSTVDPSWTEALENGARPWTATAGVSPLQHDYARIGLAVRLARTALAAATADGFAYFTDAPIPMSAAGSPEISEPLMASVFGELLHTAEPERSNLIDTLAAWFSADGSFATVATQLWVHQNTIRNRMRRIATLTGRDVSQPRQAAELYLALATYRQRVGKDPDG
ncbi:MAG TPA: helix-turn-helix domain-containing protein [Lacisediminihabitans sp.]|uniref:PucR family transcriptional regulator n=1 Tax=Lacisediminihabitans sp. TaxID=2787631 RepID=UPI002ED9B8AD